MNWKTIFAALAIALLAMVSSFSAYAHGGYRGGYYGGYYGYPRVSVGFAFGVPGYWGYPGYYYAPPAYYYPPASVAPASPPVYIERGDSRSGPAQQAQDFWYYCPESKSYYPYVQQCAGGWQKVAPQPPGG